MMFNPRNGSPSVSRRLFAGGAAAGLAAAASPGARPADQRNRQVAADLELSQEPRHAVRRRPDHRQGRRRADRRQVR